MTAPAKDPLDLLRVAQAFPDAPPVWCALPLRFDRCWVHMAVDRSMQSLCRRRMRTFVTADDVSVQGRSWCATCDHRLGVWLAGTYGCPACGVSTGYHKGYLVIHRLALVTAAGLWYTDDWCEAGGTKLAQWLTANVTV